MLEHSDRQNAQLAIILLVPASSIGVAMSLFIAPGTSRFCPLNYCLENTL